MGKWKEGFKKLYIQFWQPPVNQQSFQNQKFSLKLHDKIWDKTKAVFRSKFLF